jgi:hypothetical protein
MDLTEGVFDVAAMRIDPGPPFAAGAWYVDDT